MKLLVLAACLAVFPMAALAEPLSLVCRLDAQPARGWVQPEMAILIDSEAGSALVNDALTMTEIGGPATATIASQNDTKTVLAWEIRTSDIRRQPLRASYRAMIFKADLSITISMRPLGYDNRFRASGTCRPN